MAGHYYSKDPKVESDERTWSFELRGKSFKFTSDRGVFSKKEVDFGSRLLVDTFIMPEVDGDVLDVGCGYGPIGLSIASIDRARRVHLVDVNERALDLAKKNASNNGIDNVEIYESDTLNQVKKKDYAAILTNPPIRAGKEIVHRIFEQSYEYLAHHGQLWVVIQKKQGAPSAIDKIESLFGNVEVVEKKKGYFILCAKKID
ncbi:class I SAM-dependent methyltransferase [Alkalihalophilus lindianensis]|uniref:Class I SAM-dependent methyltransferase n=1 Tax=Alkalihalophilus lindianensis TaxID=1630542 RepID=A0ABU3XH83_9BACI|nr:class I SAM-dependent methyltransferase [Alkalihalophilus lindianensis]MDV2686703.1 class I SAM-dependent methyltransferase [Alkalihalophilus lindianensis]